MIVRKRLQLAQQDKINVLSNCTFGNYSYRKLLAVRVSY
jgi:hypothetical protein